MQRPQRGFTLVEIAIVLVVIGLLLGGVLKGQELIASSRVRNLADQQSGIQAAFYGFQDRYQAVPGDMPHGDAEAAIGTDISTSGSSLAGNGKIDANWTEINGVWEHLSKAGFIKGSFNGSDTTSTTDDAPTNAFNGILVMVRGDSYIPSGSADQLLLHMGRNVPVDIARELDVKVDDAKPDSGILRNAVTTGAYDGLGSSAGNCTATPNTDLIWDIETDSQDCNPTYLF